MLRSNARRRRPQVRVHRGRRGLTAATTAIAVLGLAALVDCEPLAGASALNYVALGDSYTSGDGIPPASPTAPVDCAQSASDYPHLTAIASGVSLKDASCAGADSADMTTEQYPDQPPQFSALSPSTNVVSVGIGGNDHNLFSDALVDCGIADALDFLDIGSPCKAIYGNTFLSYVASDAATIGAVVQGIHSRSPIATVFVVGYPDIMPQTGRCYPTMPFTTGDTAYLNALEKSLDAMLQREALANNAIFVDTFSQSIGHDACESPSVRWVNPIIASGGGVSVHPNPAGAFEMGVALQAALRANGL